MDTVVVAMPGEQARIQRIESDALAPLKELIGGYIELARSYHHHGDGTQLVLYCNEDGKRLRLAPNRLLDTGQVILGPIVAVKADPRTGCQLSLTDFEAQAVAMELNDAMLVPFMPSPEAEDAGDTGDAGI